MRVDHGSYFHNYIQKMHIYMKKKTRYEIDIGKKKKN